MQGPSDPVVRTRDGTTNAATRLMLEGHHGGVPMMKRSFLGAILATIAIILAPFPSTAVLNHGLMIRVGGNHSSNWFGYDAGAIERNGTLFMQISGRWRVPTARAHKRGQREYSAAWLGIGGGCMDTQCLAADNTLIQTGTESNVSARGHATYGAWYEL